MTVMTELVYLSCPYSHPDPAVRAERFRQANLCAGKLIEAGLLVFSPISHAHPIVVECGLPKDWEFWERHNRAYLSICRAMVVLKLDGWRDSKGVQAEIVIMRELGRSIWYLHPRNLDPLPRIIWGLGGTP